MNRIVITVILTTFVVWISSGISEAMATGLPTAWAGETTYLDVGKAKAPFCARCHGVNGITEYTTVPNLAGQNKDYLVKQLKDFRSGFRRSSSMREVALSLSDEEIVGLANYYYGLKKQPE